MMPRIDGGVIRFAEGSVEPLAHCALEWVLFSTEGRWLLQVREALPSALSPFQSPALGAVLAPRDFQDWAKRLQNWPLDFVLVEARMASDTAVGALRLQAGHHGIAPLYCARRSNQIHASWDFDEVAVRLKHRVLDFQVAACTLARQDPYSARTIYQNVSMLTAGAAIAFGDTTHHQYPLPAAPLEPRDLGADVDVPHLLGLLITNAISSRPFTGNQVAAELSGGMDSACVAIMVGRHLQAPILTTGVRVLDDSGEMQMARRHSIVRALGAEDFVVDVAQALPDLSGPVQTWADGYQADFYFTALDRLWERCEQDGRAFLLTGFGGDELYPRYPHEPPTSSMLAVSTRPTLLSEDAEEAAESGFLFAAPQTRVPKSSLGSMACRAPASLRRGLWPVHPLSDPAVVTFCHQLPFPWRNNRRATRELISRTIGVELFPSGYTKETFGPVIVKALSMHKDKLKDNFSESCLADLGLICHKEMIAAIDRLNIGQTAEEVSDLVFAIYLERFLKLSL